ncbi:UDENN domain-containing protein [Heracleum sosnowskyi]|uniref:UDENN domain-containing protein n=1 Tax=Heracleum sosnowskyi TaxID=360622 RepID=A0AAD8MR02_9APIA|nr:UDENN domain-containing protein [Heracleum sosnowskyi]
METDSKEPEKDPSLTMTPALENESPLTTTQASEKDPSSITTQASEEDPSLTTTQALEHDPSSTTQASKKVSSSTTTPTLEKDPSLTVNQASEDDPSSTTQASVKNPSTSSVATQASEKDPSSTATQVLENDPSSTTQALEKDSSLTTQVSEKDSFLKTQASDNDSSLTTTQATENDPSSTTQALEKDLSLTTQASKKDPSSITTQALEKDLSLTAQVSEKDPSLTTKKISRLPSDVSSLSLPASGPVHRRTKSDVLLSGTGNRPGIAFQKWKTQVQRAFKWVKEESTDYNFNPEILADQKRQWSQLHSDSSDLTYKEPSSIIEHFIISGLHPNSNLEVVETAYVRLKKWESLKENKEASDPKTKQQLEPPSLEPEILFEYPPGKRLPMNRKDLAAFCFPNSVKARVLERTPSLSELNEIVFGQEHLSTDDLSFVFSLKVADNATLYGVCLLVKEIVQRPPTPTMLGALTPDYRPYEGRSHVLTSAPRCYCVLTRAPFFELHYEMLKSIVTQERLTRITQFVKYVSLYDQAPSLSRSNDQKKENNDPPKEEYSTDWMATAIPIESAVALTAAAAGIISDDELFSSSSKGEHRSSESTSTETSEHKHIREIVNGSGKNFHSLDDHTNETPETLHDDLDVEQRSEVVACANPRIYGMDPSNSESLISSVSSTDENEKQSCSNGKVSREDWIVEWAKDNNNSLIQIVCSFYSMHFPERGGEITFKPLEHLQTVKYRRPSVCALTQAEKHLYYTKWEMLSALEGNKRLAAAEEAAALSIWTTAAICRALSLENILTLLTGVLLEKQVLFVCPNLGVLSAIVLSIIPIIRPFQWQSLFLPVLPGKMKDFLDAPVPFIVGMQHMPTDFKLKRSNLIHVDVAKDQVKSCKLPELPDYKDLISELGPIYFKMAKHQSVAKKRPVYSYNETEAEAAGRFLAVMRRYLYSLCTDMRSHTITSVRANNDRVSILLKDSFLASFSYRDQPFIKLFLDTQLFSVLSDTYLSNYEN